MEDVLYNKDITKCPGDCFRPAGLAFDEAGRLFVSSDATGEIYLVVRHQENDLTNTTTRAEPSRTAPPPNIKPTPSHHSTSTQPQKQRTDAPIPFPPVRPILRTTLSEGELITETSLSTEHFSSGPEPTLEPPIESEPFMSMSMPEPESLTDRPEPSFEPEPFTSYPPEPPSLEPEPTRNMNPTELPSMEPPPFEPTREPEPRTSPSERPISRSFEPEPSFERTTFKPEPTTAREPVEPTSKPSIPATTKGAPTKSPSVSCRVLGLQLICVTLTAELALGPTSATSALVTASLKVGIGG